MSDTTLHAVFLGAGPAGTGPLVNAEQRGLLPRLLDAGVAVVDQGDRMGPGTIGRHLINSDTAGGTFLECLAAEGDLFAPVTDSEPYRRLEQYRQSAAPLPVVSDFLAEIGAALRGAVDAHPVSRFLPGPGPCRSAARPTVVSRPRWPVGTTSSSCGLGT